MISFASDYLSGCLPQVLARLEDTNREQTTGYGEDHYSAEARVALSLQLAAPDADIHFLVGGTMANAAVISHILRPHQGVISAETGHIAVHEAGAIEAGGHKILTIETTDGKLSASAVQALVDAHWADFAREHTVQPGLVYVSQPTECGTLYSKDELEALYETCQKLDLPLYIDGARLAYAAADPTSDLTLADYHQVSDVITVGGTKCGLLFGEAVCFFDKRLARDFRYKMKQAGGMLAKGRLLGLQFLTLFESDLYLTAAKGALEKADRLRQLFSEEGFTFAFETTSNQVFPILPDDFTAYLRRQFDFETWQALPNDRSVVRFCTSWSTADEHLEQLAKALKSRPERYHATHL